MVAMLCVTCKAGNTQTNIWPPILVVQVDAGDEKILRAIDGNRRLYVARVASRRGAIFGVRVEVCEREDPRIAAKFYSASSTALLPLPLPSFPLLG